jgi:hypothetical protein
MAECESGTYAKAAGFPGDGSFGSMIDLCGSRASLGLHGGRPQALERGWHLQCWH